MPQKYLGQSFDTLGDDTARAEVSLVGSHLQNVCIEIESSGVDLSFILSPNGARKMIAGIEAALAAIKPEDVNPALICRRCNQRRDRHRMDGDPADCEFVE